MESIATVLDPWITALVVHPLQGGVSMSGPTINSDAAIGLGLIAIGLAGFVLSYFIRRHHLRMLQSLQ